MLNSDLEDSDDEPGSLLTVANSQHCEAADVIIVDPETPGKDDETKVSTRDENECDKRVSMDENTDNEGTEQYWKLKLKEGTQKISMLVFECVAC